MNLTVGNERMVHVVEIWRDVLAAYPGAKLSVPGRRCTIDLPPRDEMMRDYALDMLSGIRPALQDLVHTDYRVIFTVDSYEAIELRNFLSRVKTAEFKTLYGGASE